LDFHVEVDFSGFPFLAGLGQQGCDQPQEGGFIGKETGDAGAAFDFLIDRLLGFDSRQRNLGLKLPGEFSSCPFAAFCLVHFQCAFYLSHWS